MEDVRTKKGGIHSVYMENRERLVVTAVTDVKSFNDETILISMEKGGIVVKGQNLHIQRLDLEEGKVVVSGFLLSATYTEKKDKEEKNWMGRLFK